MYISFVATSRNLVHTDVWCCTRCKENVCVCTLYVQFRALNVCLLLFFFFSCEFEFDLTVQMMLSVINDVIGCLEVAEMSDYFFFQLPCSVSLE